MRLFSYPVGNTARTSDPSIKLFNASRCSTFSSKENLNLVDNYLKTSFRMSVSAILVSRGVVYVVGESTYGNFASRFWMQNTRRIGCLQALFPPPTPHHTTSSPTLFSTGWENCRVKILGIQRVKSVCSFLSCVLSHSFCDLLMFFLVPTSVLTQYFLCRLQKTHPSMQCVPLIEMKMPQS